MPVIVLAEAVSAPENIPPFDKFSAMDGFAVRAADVKTATEENPTVLSVVETIAAGHAPTKQVLQGQAARIMTGAMMPEGADAVVMQEVTELFSRETRETHPTVHDSVKIFETVSENLERPFCRGECQTGGAGDNTRKAAPCPGDIHACVPQLCGGHRASETDRRNRFYR